MREELIYDAVTNIDEDLIEAAQTKKRLPVKWMAAAAAVALVVGVGSVALPKLLGGRQSATADGSGSGEGSTFMSYAGPVLPLTLGEENGSIRVQREITMDFAPWVHRWITNEEDAASRDWLTADEQEHVLEELEKVYPEGGREESSTDILITDQYVLTNDSAGDQTVTIRYPYVTSFRDEEKPVLTVNGEPVEMETIYGGDAGGFYGLSQEDTGAWNVQNPNSWTDYQDLLENGTYETAALAPAPDLSATPVILYRFTDSQYTWSDEEPENPDLVAVFDQDYDATRVLSYGFNMGSWDQENGTTALGYSIGRVEWRTETKYLLVFGEDIGPMELCSDFPEEDDTYAVSAQVVREETNLDTALREITAEMMSEDSGYLSTISVDLETYYEAVARAFVSYGPLADNAAERYSNGMLEDLLTDLAGRQRVAYLQTEVTIPAGGSVDVDIEMVKEGSYDFFGAGGRQPGIYGYDMTTTLASNLSFTDQTATLLDHGQIEIVRQNFGFDLENDITTVKLDMEEPHYYLEVRRATNS